MRRRKASENKPPADEQPSTSSPPMSTDEHKHEHKHDELIDGEDRSHLAPPDSIASPAPSSASVTRRRRNRSATGDSDDIQLLDDDGDDDSRQLDRRRPSFDGGSSLDPPRPMSDDLDSPPPPHYGIASSDDDYDNEDEEDVDLFSKIDFSDLDIDAMNAKLVVFMIFLFGLYFLIFFTQGNSYAIAYLFILLLLCLVGIYGSFSFSPTALKVFWGGLLLWTLVCSVTFIGLVFTGALDDIAEGRCANEEFRQVVSEFNGRDCEDEVTTQLLWESTGTAVALAFLLLWCSYSVRKFQKKVKQKWDMEEFNDHSLR